MDKDKYIKRHKYRGKANIYSVSLIIIGLVIFFQFDEEMFVIVGLLLVAIGFLISNLLDSG